MTNSHLSFPDLEFLNSLPYGPDLWEAVQRWPRSAIGRINTITHFAEFSCAGDVWVYIETLLPALGTLYLALVDFDFDDVLRGFFRPTGLRSRRKFRDGTRSGRKKKGSKLFDVLIPEIGEMIGKNLPVSRWVRGRKVGTAERWLWKVDAVAQRALYYWLIVDVTIDFFYNWSTGIIRHPKCWRSEAGWFSGGPSFLGTTADGVVRSTGAPPPHARGGVDPPSGVPVYVRPGDAVAVGVWATKHDSLLKKVSSVSLWIDKEAGDDSPPERVGRWTQGLRPGDDDFAVMALTESHNRTSRGYWLVPKVVAVADGPDAAYLHDFTVYARRL